MTQPSPKLPSRPPDFTVLAFGAGPCPSVLLVTSGVQFAPGLTLGEFSRDAIAVTSPFLRFKQAIPREPELQRAGAVDPGGRKGAQE